MNEQTNHSSLSKELQNLLSSDEKITLGSVFNKTEEKGFGILLIILSLPSALPLPAAGYSIPFGLVLFVIGCQMLIGKARPSMPARAQRIELGAGIGRKMLSAASWFLTKMEAFIKPRLSWIGSRGGRIFMGILVILMATLMIIPIPSTNTFPAMVIFLIGVGLSEDDGFFAIAACLVGCSPFFYTQPSSIFSLFLSVNTAGTQWTNSKTGSKIPSNNSYSC